MDAPSEKRIRLHQILDGQVEFDSPFIESAALKQLANQPEPVLHSQSTPVKLGLPVVALMAVAGGLAVRYFNSPIYNVSLLFAIGLAVTIIWYFAVAREERIIAMAATLEHPLKELRDLRRFIVDYLEELDRRTSRYFHCVTNTKVTSYFSLTQISVALAERVDFAASLLKDPTRDNVLSAWRSLRGSLVFNDGLSSLSSNTHMIPLEKLRAVVVMLTEDMDKGIAELEAEIAQNDQGRIQNPPPQDKTS